MHIPRGYWHQATRAESGDGYSLHATFGFVKRTGVDWLTWVADRSREHEVFRQDLDRFGAPNDQLVDLVPKLLAGYPHDAYLAAREQERPSRRHVNTSGVFGPVTDVVCMTDFPPHIDVSEQIVTVVAAGKELTFAAKAEPALRLLLSGNPANIEEVAEASGIKAGVVASTLVKEGLCAELTAELAAGYAGLCSPDL